MTVHWPDLVLPACERLRLTITVKRGSSDLGPFLLTSGAAK